MELKVNQIRFDDDASILPLTSLCSTLNVKDYGNIFCNVFTLLPHRHLGP